MTISNALKLGALPYFRRLVILFSLGIVAGLLFWSLRNYQPPPTIYGPRAIYSVIFLSLLLALMGRVLLLRMLKLEIVAIESKRFYHHLPASWRILFLFDITAPIYLAAGVLVSTPAAVLVALVTQVALQSYTLLRRFVSLSGACYRVVSTALVVLVSDSAFTWFAGTQQYRASDPFSLVTESSELLGSIVAALIMLCLLTLAALPILLQSKRDDPGLLSSVKVVPALSFSLWREYFQSPVLRFQALVLSVGPLLSLVDVYDNAFAELAWLFFLVPLFAIYYLALVSTRLSIRTDALQKTLEDLRSARRRQDELRDYASLVTRVQEEERRRLARELHDDTAQALIALSLGLDGLGRAMGKHDLPQKDRKWLKSLQDLADHTLEGVRRACRDLRPSVLDDLGLRAALEWMSDSSSSRGVSCTFTCIGTPYTTTPECEIAMFRIAQEALSNIWKHAHASQASIELHYYSDMVQLTIRDNGNGFDTDPFLRTLHSSQGGLGLVGMRERAMLIGAALNIISSPGKGCQVVLSLPLIQELSPASTT